MSVLHLQVSKEDFFTDVYSLRKPCVIHGMDIGHAQTLWTAQYLADKCGSREVKVHVSPQENMDFINKNFIYKYIHEIYTCIHIYIYNYRTLPFNEFVTRASTDVPLVDYFLSPVRMYLSSSLPFSVLLLFACYLA